ncbi:MAG: tetratricopeptide repeat protein, partial [Flavipsychrobacter sp.]
MRIKQKKLNKQFACFIASLVIGNFAQAQVSVPEQPANRWLFLMEEQYQQGHYQLALQSANKYLYQSRLATDIKPHDELEKAAYYRAASEIKLNTAGCIDTAEALLASTTNPVYKQRLAYVIAQYYFHRNELNEATRYYEMAGISNLSNKELIDERFELAYSYFNNKQFDKAEPLFASIKELQQGKYFSAGNYYYGLLAYNENNYKDALQSFDRIKDLSEYRSIVPYYIAEIHYFMGERDRALNYSLELMKRPEKLYYDNELHLLAAQCYFEDQQYSYALPYFEYYYD